MPTCCWACCLGAVVKVCVGCVELWAWACVVSACWIETCCIILFEIFCCFSSYSSRVTVTRAAASWSHTLERSFALVFRDFSQAFSSRSFAFAAFLEASSLVSLGSAGSVSWLIRSFGLVCFELVLEGTCRDVGLFCGGRSVFWAATSAQLALGSWAVCFCVGFFTVVGARFFATVRARLLWEDCATGFCTAVGATGFWNGFFAAVGARLFAAVRATLLREHCATVFCSDAETS